MVGERLVKRPQILDLVETYAQPVTTVGQIRDKLEEDYDIETTKLTVSDRLDELEEDGKVERRQVKQIHLYYPTSRFDKLDDDLEERVDQYAEDDDLTQSAAVHELVRTGIEAERNGLTILEFLEKATVFLLFSTLIVAYNQAPLGPIGMEQLLIGAFLTAGGAFLLQVWLWLAPGELVESQKKRLSGVIPRSEPEEKDEGEPE